MLAKLAFGISLLTSAILIVFSFLAAFGISM